MKTNQTLIIVAIVLITVVGLFFLLSGKTNTTPSVSNTNNTSAPLQEDGHAHEH